MENIETKKMKLSKYFIIIWVILFVILIAHVIYNIFIYRNYVEIQDAAMGVEILADNLANSRNIF